MRLDLPLPVPPIMAVVLPGSAMKLISSRVFSSASGYAKLTFLNSTRPLGMPQAFSSHCVPFAFSASPKAAGSAGSVIVGSTSSTAPIR